MTAEENTKIIEIDVCGQICPSTLLTALQEVNKEKQRLHSGEVQLRILTDNHDSTNRIFETVSNMGYLVEVEDRKKYFHINISKSN